MRIGPREYYHARIELDNMTIQKEESSFVRTTRERPFSKYI